MDNVTTNLKKQRFHTLLRTLLILVGGWLLCTPVCATQMNIEGQEGEREEKEIIFFEEEPSPQQGNQNNQNLLNSPGNLQLSSSSLSGQQLKSGYTMIYKGQDQTTRMWQWSGLQPNTTFPMPRLGHMTSLAFDPNTDSILTSDSMGHVCMYDSKNWQTRHTAQLHQQPISQVVFDGEGELAASTSHDSTVKVWKAKTGQLLSTLKHPKPVQSMVFYPQDSDMLASLASDGVVRIWALDDKNDPEVSRQFGNNPREYTNEIRIDSKGKLLVSGSQDGHLRYWKATSSRKKPFSVVQAHTGPINTVSFSPQDQVLSGGQEGIVKLWDKNGSNNALITLKAHQKPLQTVAFHPTGSSLVASAGDDAFIRLWDTKTGQPTQAFPGHKGGTTRLIFIADGALLVSVGHDDTLRVWDLKTGKQQPVFQNQPGWKLTYKGQQMALNVDKQMQQGLRIDQLQGLTTTKSRLSSTESELTTTRNSLNQSNSLVEKLQKQMQEELTKKNSLVEKLQKEKTDEYEGLHLQHFTKDSQEIQDLVQRVKKDEDLRRKLWHFVALSKKRPTMALIAANAMTVLNAARKSFVGKHLQGIHVTTKDNDTNTYQGPDLRGASLMRTNFRGADLRGAQFKGPYLHHALFNNTLLADARFNLNLARFPQNPILTGHTSYVNSVSFSPDGNTLASGSWDNTIRVWDVATGRQLRQLQGHTNSVYATSFSPDGTTLASGSWDNTIRLWKVSTGEQLRQLQGHTRYVNSVSFSPDGTTLASGSDDHTIRLWKVSTGEQLRQLQGHTSDVNSVSFSPDGTTLASGSHDKTIRLWKVSTGQQLRQLQGHTSYVRSVSFSPDGTRLASNSHDKTVCIWDLQSGQEIKRFDAGSIGGLGGLQWSPDGRLLASAGGDYKQIKLWDVASCQLLKTLTGHTAAVRRLSWSPNGQMLASGSSDKTVRLWDVSGLLYEGADFTGAQGLSRELKRKLTALGVKGIQMDDEEVEQEQKRDE